MEDSGATQTQTTPQTPTKQPTTIIKSIDPNMTLTLNEQIEYLKAQNSGIQSLNYFYEVYKGLYTNRSKELLHQKNQGKKIIGTFCNFIPLELILASDAVPIRLTTGFQDPILPAEEILPRNFCPLIKSSYGFSVMDSPHFDLVDVIIVPTTCDGKKKLAEILSEKKPTWVIEVPHTTETPQARQLWLTEFQLLKKQLEKLTGNKITSKKVQTAIKLVNRKRAVARRLYELRKRSPPTIWGRDAMLVTNLSLFDDTKRWTERTEALCNELEKHKPVCDASLPRIMVTGSPTVFPTWKIPVLTEESGGVIVMDDICSGSKEMWDPIEASNWSMNDMLIAMADKYLMNTCACFTPNFARLNRIIQFANEFKIDGVLYHILLACHIYGMEQLRIEKALDKINIPVLSIETDYSQEDVEQIRTRIEAFMEMVSIRKEAKSRPETAPPTATPTPATPITSSTPAPVASDPTAAIPAPAVADPTSPAPSHTPVPSPSDPTQPQPTPNDPTSAMTTTPATPATPASTSSTPVTTVAPAAPAPSSSTPTAPTASTAPPTSAAPATPAQPSNTPNPSSTPPTQTPTKENQKKTEE
jgi:benzoyl-CoA reductase/2-hydroxyglutaryl-CoA dehydratase subunit BcrC/BadD/HgdB